MYTVCTLLVLWLPSTLVWIHAFRSLEQQCVCILSTGGVTRGTNEAIVLCEGECAYTVFRCTRCVYMHDALLHCTHLVMV